MTTPFRCDDGDHDELLEISRDMKFPFSERGDFETFEVIIKYNQDKIAFSKLPVMSKVKFPLGTAYLVEQGPPTDVGFGLFEFTRTFSSIPATRSEFETVAQPFVIFQLIGSASKRSDSTLVTNAEVIYEYFNNIVPPLIIAPRFFLFDSFGNGNIPRRIVVSDSAIEIYKGKIFSRKTSYANISESVFLLNI